MIQKDAVVVQFPHPGAEHQPTAVEMAWNRREHARKFLLAHGRRIEHGIPIDGSFAFWGEWEPQSRVVQTFPHRQDGSPGWLHEPYWNVSRHRASLQNTDPLVFGDRFLYSNCRQGRNAKLRSLPPGSLVLFGSKVRSEFVIDTVFVVADPGQPFSKGDPSQLRVPSWVRSVVLDPLAMGRGDPTQAFRFYRGRRYDDDSSKPFSFVPCRSLDDPDLAFPRPAIRLPAGWISSGLAMAAKTTPATEREIHDIWREVVDQVERAGLALGVALDAPPHAEGR